MVRFVTKTIVLAVGVLAPLAPALGSEITISLRATVEPRCEIVDIQSDPAGSASRFQVQVSCNAPQFQLSVVGRDGSVPIELKSASTGRGTATAQGNSVAVSPRRPGLYVFDLELREKAPDRTAIMVQLDGF